MKQIMTLLIVLGIGAASALAQECPSGGCEIAKPAVEAKAAQPVSATAKIEKLEASAAKGCQSSKALLAKLQTAAEVDTVAALKTKVEACEKYAGQGCSVSKQILAKIDAEMAAKKAKAPLSVRLAKMEKGCEKGCKTSQASMAGFLKQYEVADAKALVALVQSWEAKAAKGCEKCTAKLAGLEAKMPVRKAALSVRLAKLDQGCEKGCEKSKAKMAALLKEYEAADSADLIAKVQGWETKAANGCAKCKTKLAALAAEMPVVAATAPAAKSEKKSDCTDCTDCEKGCESCPSAAG